MLAIISTITVYLGFALISEFRFWFIKFPCWPKFGIILLLISNILWIIKFSQTSDYTEMAWQAGFIIINFKWLLKGE